MVSVTITPGSTHQVGLVKHVLKRLGREDVPVGARKPDHPKECVSGFHYKWLGKIAPADPDALAVDLLVDMSSKYVDDLNIICGAALSNVAALRERSGIVHKLVAQGGFAGDNIVAPEHVLEKFKGKITCPTFNLNADVKAGLAVLASAGIHERWFVSKNVCHGIKYDQERIKMSNRIKELVVKINDARSAYYNGVSQVSDKVYDAWVDELSVLDPKNPAVIGIGADPISNWEKYIHLTPMGSLNKVNTIDDYKKWHDKYIGNSDNIFLTLKLDGISVSLIYEDGVLKKAATRGSGIKGDLITPNVAKMIGVPLRLKDKINITVRGEILLSKDNHNKHFSDYSNPRNAASGISRRYDGEGCDKLSVVTYMLYSDDLDIKTYNEMFKVLESLGFIVPTYYVLNTYNEVLKYKNDYQSSLRDKYEYLLDGLVIHNNDLAKQQSYGSLNGRPYCSIAFKFDNETRESTIKDIVWQVGNSGRLTPVAIIDPVSLVGATVTKASIYNMAYIKSLHLDIGAKVLVARANDVIPRIEELIQGTGKTVKPPTTCPECGQPVIMLGENLTCVNRECPAQIIGRIKNWIKDLNILEWGDTLIEKLVRDGLVEDPADLYTLTVDDLASIERMGKKSAEKCYKLLWAGSEVTLDVFLGALSIPMIGSSTIRLIMDEGCDDIVKFGQLKAENFEMVPGVGPAKAESLAEGLLQNKDLIIRLLNNGVKIKEPATGELSGVSVCFTGSMKNKRSELQKMATDAGAKLKSSVGKGLDVLVIADPNSTSSKAKAARKFGVKLVSEDDFLTMVQ